MRKISKITFFILCILAGLIYFWNTRVDSNLEHVNAVLDLTRCVRPISTENKQIFCKDFIKKIEELLIDYTTDNDIKKTIIKFLQKTIGQKFDDFNIKQIDSSPQKGLSGNKLFLIRDAKNDLKFVVKIFEKPFEPNETGFLSELSGFQLASTIHGKNFNLISALAIGKCVINKNQYGLLVMSAANGISIADLMLKLMLYLEVRNHFEFGSVFNTEIKETFCLLKRAIEKLGIALAELHQIRKIDTKKSHPEAISKEEKFIKNAIEMLNKGNYGIDLNILKKYFESLLNRLKNIETTYSIIHGDTNFGNFIYDKKTDSLSLVDLASIGLSVDQNGNPIQNAASDSVGIVNEIETCLKTGMPKEEFTEIRKTFIDAYGKVPTQLEQEFFALVDRLKFILFFITTERSNPKKLTALKRSFQLYIDEIKEATSKFKDIQR